MTPNELRELLRAGIEAARSGNPIIARDYLRRVLAEEPNNELAWLWMARASDTKADRQAALERVLAINPGNDKARAALEQLRGESIYDVYEVPDAPRETSSSLSSQQDTPTTAAQQSVEQDRDWLQPIQRPRRDADLWRSKRQDNNNLIILLGIALAVGIIGIAVVLLIGELESDDDSSDTGDDQAAVDLGATQTADVLLLTPVDTLVPSNTPRPTSPLLLTPRDNQLPPTLAPTITNTPLPTPTATPEPLPPGAFRVMMTSSEIPGAPSRLYTALGNGGNYEEFELNFQNAVEAVLPPVDEPPAEADEPPPADETDDTSEESTSDESAALPASLAGNDELHAMVRRQGPRIEVYDPVYSPDGEFVAFTLQVNQIQELFVATVNGDDSVTAITSLGADETRGASWSPDGESILFHSNADGDFDLYTVPAEGGDPVNITDSNSNDRDPSWSPDGRFIAFASDRAGGGTLEIYVIGFGAAFAGPESDFAVDSGSICQLTDASDSSFAPAWSPNGRFIAFISNRDRDNDLYVMNADGSNEQIISSGDGFVWQERAPAWSPDSQWIAVSSNRLDDPFNTTEANQTSKIWIVRPDVRNSWQRITEGDSNELSIAWDPGSFDGPSVDDLEFRCAAG